MVNLVMVCGKKSVARAVLYGAFQLLQEKTGKEPLEVFKQAVKAMGAVAEEALAANGLTVDDVDWFIPHQANKRILQATAKRVNIPESKVVMAVDHHGNTSAASVPLALDEAVRDGRIRPGHLVLLDAFGGGFAWGSAFIRW